jgi:hypothetical protein
VSVTEGVVSVRAGGLETRVSRGREWTGACVPGASPNASTSATRGANAARAEAREKRRGTMALETPPPEAASTAPTEAVPAEETTATRAPAQEASKLGAQNDLFAAAAQARNHGNSAEAARLFAQLVRDFPRSPLVESALIQRMKALATFDGAAGARAAREYLERFPGGIALAEARRLIDRPVP